MTGFTRISASFELAPPPTERIAHRRHYDLRLTHAEAVLLWRLRKRLQALMPPGKTVSADDALRHLLRSCVGAADAEDAGAEIEPAPVDVSAVEQAAVGTIFDEPAPGVPVLVSPGHALMVASAPVEAGDVVCASPEPKPRYPKYSVAEMRGDDGREPLPLHALIHPIVEPDPEPPKPPAKSRRKK